MLNMYACLYGFLSILVIKYVKKNPTRGSIVVEVGICTTCGCWYAFAPFVWKLGCYRRVLC